MQGQTLQNQTRHHDLFLGLPQKEGGVKLVTEDVYAPSFASLAANVFPDLPAEDEAVARRLLKGEGWLALYSKTGVKSPKLETPLNPLYAALALKYPALKSFIKVKYASNVELVVNYQKGVLPNLLGLVGTYLAAGIKALKKLTLAPPTTYRLKLKPGNALVIRLEPGVYAQRAYYPLGGGTTTISAMLDKAAAIGLEPESVEFALRVRAGFLVPTVDPSGNVAYAFKELSEAALLKSGVTAQKALRLAAFQLEPVKLVQALLAEGYRADVVLTLQKKLTDAVARLFNARKA